MFLAIATRSFQYQRSIFLWIFMFCINELIDLQKPFIWYFILLFLLVIFILVWFVSFLNGICFVVLFEHFWCASLYKLINTQYSWNKYLSSTIHSSFQIYYISNRFTIQITLYSQSTLYSLYSIVFIKQYPNENCIANYWSPKVFPYLSFSSNRSKQYLTNLPANINKVNDLRHFIYKRIQIDYH